MKNRCRSAPAAGAHQVLQEFPDEFVERARRQGLIHRERFADVGCRCARQAVREIGAQPQQRCEPPPVGDPERTGTGCNVRRRILDSEQVLGVTGRRPPAAHGGVGVVGGGAGAHHRAAVAEPVLGEQRLQRRRPLRSGRRCAYPDGEDAIEARGVVGGAERDAHRHPDAHRSVEIDHPLERIGNDDPSGRRVAREPRILQRRVRANDEIVRYGGADCAPDFVQAAIGRVGRIGENDEAVRQQFGARHRRRLRQRRIVELQIRRCRIGIGGRRRAHDIARAIGASGGRQRIPCPFISAAEVRVVRILLCVGTRAPIGFAEAALGVGDCRERRSNADVVGKKAHAQFGGVPDTRELGLHPHRQQHERQLIRAGSDGVLRRLAHPLDKARPRFAGETSVLGARCLPGAHGVRALALKLRHRVALAGAPRPRDRRIKRAKALVRRDGARQRGIAARAQVGDGFWLRHPCATPRA